MFASLAEGEDIALSPFAGEPSALGAPPAISSVHCPQGMYNTFTQPACYTRFLTGGLPVWGAQSPPDPSAVYFVVEVHGEIRIGAFSPTVWNWYVTPERRVKMLGAGIKPVTNMITDHAVFTKGAPKGAEPGFYGANLDFGMPAAPGPIPTIKSILYGLPAGRTLRFEMQSHGVLALVMPPALKAGTGGRW